MSKLVKKELEPELRFPEFLGMGKWDKIKFIDVADKKIKWSFIGGPFGSNLKSSDYVADGIRIIQLQNIGDGEFKGDYKIFTSEEKANELLSNNIYPNEIILSKMGDPVGRACLIPDTHKRYVMCSDGIRLVVDEELFSKYFIYTLINSVQFRALVEKTATGSTRKRIGLDDLKKLLMIVPKRDEQQKIADCLSSIDELITSHTKKYDALKAHKKGLMQQLFPAEGETVPKLRFPAFRDAGEWEERKLGEVASFLKGKGISKADITTDGKQPCIRYGELYTLYNETIENISSHTNITANNLVLSKSNDVIIPASGETQEDIATASCVMESGIALGGDLNIIRTKMNGVFLSYYLNSAKKYFIAQMSQGISVVHLYPSQLKNLGINIPKIIEQQKIANCLSSIDNLITTQAQKIESLKAHKKGLMQQLFPATDEVTA
ncbi:restriction endonuclease subunit S [Bathymodiolus septemdierum thioautotrophic gill symbiont]|uniref:Type I restriction enzyme, S subunit n=1 Tax=endosymbiont of Bathymodiolus septemdierum str. Myojin knoll TaxID=1303921 RepID=A0A0P0USU5_9GAMM|nr:restriction endonuclease subunit S [Bathymodiolus septemdierum thioautotrophic gill symbiont]BAS68178.1 type I restriction enzyme, S subunit [endosymbiont of Bathymodiolus septemdierum str. Myojin knoll]